MWLLTHEADGNTIDKKLTNFFPLNFIKSGKSWLDIKETCGFNLMSKSDLLAIHTIQQHSSWIYKKIRDKILYY